MSLLFLRDEKHEFRGEDIELIYYVGIPGVPYTGLSPLFRKYRSIGSPPDTTISGIIQWVNKLQERFPNLRDTIGRIILTITPNLWILEYNINLNDEPVAALAMDITSSGDVTINFEDTIPFTYASALLMNGGTLTITPPETVQLANFGLLVVPIEDTKFVFNGFTPGTSPPPSILPAGTEWYISIQNTIIDAYDPVSPEERNEILSDMAEGLIESTPDIVTTIIGCSIL